MRLLAASLVLLNLTATPAQALFGKSEKGTTTAAFLKVGVSARAAAMGEAVTSITDDASALYWNPAGLTHVRGNSISVMRADYLAETSYNYAAYARKLESGRALGFSWQHFSAGSVRGTNTTGVLTGDISPSDTAFTSGYAVPFAKNTWMEDGSFGVNLKYVRSTLATTASAWALDVGLLFPPGLDDRYRAGVVLSNFGTRMTFDQAKEPLPLVLRFGQSLDITEEWKVTMDFSMPRDNAPYPAAGLEYRLPMGIERTMFLRTGYNGRVGRDTSGISGITTGMGILFGGIGFDYAFMPMGSLGATHRFSLNFNWGNEQPYLFKSSETDTDTLKVINKPAAYSSPEELPPPSGLTGW